MLTFNALLEDVGLDPKTVKLVRHKDNRFTVTPYSVWRTDKTAYLTYNQIQKPNKFARANFIATFVVTPANETLFTGVYKLGSVGTAPAGTFCPVSQREADPVETVFYDLSKTDYLSEYEGRVIIDWGAGAIAWVQWANRQPKQIVEVRKEFTEPSFLGFEKFSAHLDELNSVPENWKTVLRSVQGVYLLVHIGTNQLYVGSAYGAGGFWARWESYIANGHGGNVELQALNSRDYRLSVLKVCSSDATMEEVISAENNWKEKLCSRSLGLNAN